MAIRSTSTGKPSILKLITLLLLIAALPGVAMVIYGYKSVQDEAVAQAREEVRSAAEMAAATQEQLVEGVRQILATVTNGPSVRREGLLDLCNEYLTNLSRTFPSYGSISVVDLQGRLRCLSDSSTKAVAVKELPVFERALTSRQFAMDDYSSDASTSGGEIGFAMPVFDYAETVKGAAYATLDLALVSARLESLLVSKSVTVMITDGQGTVLATNNRDVQDIGVPIANPVLLQRIARSATQGRVAPDDAEEDWLHEVVRVGEMNSQPVYAIASARRSEILAGPLERLQRQLIFLALAFALGIAAALKLAQRQFISPISGLVKRMEAAAKQKTAIPSTEPAVDAPSREFAALEKTFAGMLQELNKRNAQLSKSQEITRVGFFELDLKTQRYSASRMVRDILGLQDSQVRLTPEEYTAMIHPADREMVREQRKNLLVGDKPLRLQYRIIRADGQTRWVDSFGLVKFDREGRPTV